jgi:hypothetical protein
MMMTLSTGQSFDSDMSDATAIARLCDIADEKALGTPPRALEFAKSLVTSWRRYGSLTERQWPYVHKLVNEAIERAQSSGVAPEKPTHKVGDFSQVYAMFQHAAESLRKPKISFDLESGDRVRLYLAGPNSKYAGSIMVTDDGHFPNNRWYGHVTKGGVLVEGKNSDQDVIAFLKRFAADPAEVAAEYGRETGNCCFCARPLTDPRSVEVGYGPVCSEKYQLPWG